MRHGSRLYKYKLLIILKQEKQKKVRYSRLGYQDASTTIVQPAEKPRKRHYVNVAFYLEFFLSFYTIFYYICCKLKYIHKCNCFICNFTELTNQRSLKFVLIFLVQFHNNIYILFMTYIYGRMSLCGMQRFMCKVHPCILYKENVLYGE